MGLDADLRALAELQYGLVARRQARQLGATYSALKHRLTSSDWETESARVVRLRGSDRSDAQRAMAAVLDAGHAAVLSHHSAAAWWGLPGFDLRDLHVTRSRARSGHGIELAQLHEVRALPPHHVTVLRRMPVTTPARTLFDLAALVPPKRVERALDNAWSKRIVDGYRMAAILDDLGRRGRGGTQVIRALLVERGPEYVPPASGLEGRVRDLGKRAGLSLIRQVDLGRATWLGRVDFYDREARIAVQVDSAMYHSALVDRRTDAAQTEAMRAAGFEVLRFTDTEVWYHGDFVVSRILKTRTGHRNGRSAA